MSRSRAITPAVAIVFLLAVGFHVSAASEGVFSVHPIARQETAESAQTPRLIRNDPGWPMVVELNVGDSCEASRSVDGKPVTRRIKVISVSHRWEPDYWIDDNPDHKTLSAARVVIDVSRADIISLSHFPKCLRI